MRGIVTVLNTPFRNDNSIDVDGLRQNVANALDVGVVGFLAPALAGEVNLLTFDEKRRLIEEIVAEVILWPGWSSMGMKMSRPLSVCRLMLDSMFAISVEC